MYMSILGKPTEQELEQYPHVLLTSPHEWDPSLLDYAHPNTLRAVTLTIHKVKNGVLRDVEVTFRKFKEARIRHRGLRRVILKLFHNISVADLPLLKSGEGLSVIGLQGFHCILTRQLIDLCWQIDRSIIPFKRLLGSSLMRLGLNGCFRGGPGLEGGGFLEGKAMDLIELTRRMSIPHKVTLEPSQRHLRDSQHRQVLPGNCRHFFFCLY